jgi:hypothetical protein
MAVVATSIDAIINLRMLFLLAETPMFSAVFSFRRVVILHCIAYATRLCITYNRSILLVKIAHASKQ